MNLLGQFVAPFGVVAIAFGQQDATQIHIGSQQVHHIPAVGFEGHDVVVLAKPFDLCEDVDVPIVNDQYFADNAGIFHDVTFPVLFDPTDSSSEHERV